MMNIRWSWIFIMYLLLVRQGATLSDDDHTIGEIHWRAGPYKSTWILDSLNLDSITDPPKKSNVGGIVGGSIGGLAVLCILVFFFSKRRRRRIIDVEEGSRSPTTLKKERLDSRLSDPRSQFSTDGKDNGKISLRDVLSRRPRIGKKAPLDNILPTYKVALPPGSTESIDRPSRTVATHVPHYPSILERGSKKRPSPPPPLEGYPDFYRVSLTDSGQSRDVNDRERIGRRKLQIPPTALIVTTPGRTLPNTIVTSAQSAGLHMRKSPSRRRSFFSNDTFKHPFIPVRGIDTTLRFPPGSPLSAHYQPSRQHLEARMEGRSPRIGSGPSSARPEKDSASVERPFPPPDGSGSSKQARLVEALQSAGIEISRTPRTPALNCSSNALPPQSNNHPLHIAKFLPRPPTASYI